MKSVVDGAKALRPKTDKAMYYVKQEKQRNEEREREREREREKDRHNVLKYFDIISHNTHAYAASSRTTPREGKKRFFIFFLLFRRRLVFLVYSSSSLIHFIFSNSGNNIHSHRVSFHTGLLL